MALEFNALYTPYGLSEAVNKIPNNYGLINVLGLAPEAPLTSTFVRVDVQSNNLVVLEAQPRGAPPAEAKGGDAKAHIFEIPSFPTTMTFKPDDIRDILRMVGDQLRPEAADEYVNRLMNEKLRPDHEITLEYLRLSALKGVIKDGKGTTLVNLFTRFGITKKTVSFDLGNAATDVKAKNNEVLSHMRKKLLGETMSGAMGLCSTSFFDKLVNHASVKELYTGWAAAEEARHPDRVEQGGQFGRRFKMDRIMYQEYDADFPLQGGSSEAAVATDKCHFFPLGTRSAFRTFLAPANDIRTVNTLAQWLYISTEVLKHGRGVEALCESCPLPLWNRPELLVEGSA